MSEPFIAEIRIFAGNFAPRGWALCNGQILPVAQNTALFSLIGTIYGGDGRNTTALPNLQGRAPMGPGRGPGLTERRLGERIGSDSVTISEASLPSHRHTLDAAAPSQISRANSPSPGGNVLAGVGSGDAYAPSTSNIVELADSAVGNEGAGMSHNNVQPFLVLDFIIALTGLYPTRG